MFGFNRITDSQPKRALVRDGVVFAAVILTKGDNRDEILADLSASHATVHMRLDTGAVLRGGQPVNQVTEQFLILLAVHFFQPLRSRNFKSFDAHLSRSQAI